MSADVGNRSRPAELLAASQFERVNALLPQLKSAIERYEGDENWATVAALCTACCAVDGQEWAVHELLSNPAWSVM